MANIENNDGGLRELALFAGAGGGMGESACKRERKRVTNGNSILTTMKNMSRKDDAALTGQGMVETPRTDELRDKWAGDPTAIGYFEELEAFCGQLERELNQAVKERDKLKCTLSRLIKLHERKIETGEPISGEDWEIAGYAVESKLSDL